MNEFDDMLPDRVRRELRREVRSSGVAHGRVMAAVRRDALSVQRGGWLAPAAGFAAAAVLAIGVALGPMAGWSRSNAGTASGTARVASMTTSLRDTLMLIRFALSSPGAASVALVGDFNGWQRGTTALTRGRRAGEWGVTVAMAAGSHRYAYVVDDTQWVIDPRDPQADAQAPNGRRASRLIVPKPD